MAYERIQRDREITKSQLFGGKRYGSDLAVRRPFCSLHAHQQYGADRFQLHVSRISSQVHARPKEFLAVLSSFRRDLAGTIFFLSKMVFVRCRPSWPSRHGCRHVFFSFLKKIHHCKKLFKYIFFV